jgi:hypothetical protein
VLRIFGYFKESVVESAVENWRVRRVVIYYYLEDDSIHVAEPRQDNSGLPQVRADGGGARRASVHAACRQVAVAAAALLAWALLSPSRLPPLLRCRAWWCAATRSRSPAAAGTSARRTLRWVGWAVPCWAEPCCAVLGWAGLRWVA